MWMRARLRKTNKLQKKVMEINHQQLTRGHKTLGDKWLLELRFSNKSPLYLDR